MDAIIEDGKSIPSRLAALGPGAQSIGPMNAALFCGKHSEPVCAALSDHDACSKSIFDSCLTSHQPFDPGTRNCKTNSAKCFCKKSFGAHYGGSPYSMTDPFYMLVLIENPGCDFGFATSTHGGLTAVLGEHAIPVCLVNIVAFSYV